VTRNRSLDPIANRPAPGEASRGGPSPPEGRRGSTVLLYRMAVLIVAVWSLLATTVLVFVLAEGGFDAILLLLRAPGALFRAQALDDWIVGAVGAFGVFALTFLLTQAVGRGMLRVLDPRPLAWPAGLAPPEVPVRLLAFPSDRAEAFTFALLSASVADGWRREEVIMVSDALLGALSPEEWTAVVAHELGHVRELDGRYLTFLRTFARLARWDPILALVASRFSRREEFQADADAVALTRRPRALARALYKASRLAPAVPLGGTALLGPTGRAGRTQTEQRIRRLVALAESGLFEEETVG
jgi:Zn-dependent protease with chaperone function